MERIVQEAGSVRSRVEAAEVLAQLGWKRGDPALVERACRAGLEWIRQEEAQSKTGSVSASSLPDYLERLLRRRLETDPDEAFPEAKRAYEEAMRLFLQGQYAEAGKRFWQIGVQWPSSSWAQAAGYRVGQSLVLVGRLAEAHRHWEAFLAGPLTGAPPGRPVHGLAGQVRGLPYRGQAAVALVDLLLQSTLDVPTARQLAHAAGSILDRSAYEWPIVAVGPGGSATAVRPKSAVPKVGPVHPGSEAVPSGKTGSLEGASARRPSPAQLSWEAAAFQVRLREGILDLATDHRPSAQQALQKAQALLLQPSGPGFSPEKKPAGRPAPDPWLQQGLEKLLRSAEPDAEPLIPPSVWREAQPFGQLVYIGTAYRLCGQYESAIGVMEAVLAGAGRKTASAHRSLAALEKGRALVALVHQEPEPGMRLRVLHQLGRPQAGRPGAAGQGRGPSAIAGDGKTGPGKQPQPTETQLRRGLALWAKHAYQQALQEEAAEPALSGKGPSSAAKHLLDWHDQTLRELALLIEGLAEWEGADLAAPAVGQEGSAASAGSGPGPAASATRGAAPAAAGSPAPGKPNPEQGRSGFGDVRSPDGGTTAGKPNPEQIRQNVLAVRAETCPTGPN